VFRSANGTYLVYVLASCLVCPIAPGSHGRSRPAGFLLPNTQYDLATGTVSRAGNVALAETAFTAAADW
jgi:hypothetical protein